MIMSWSSVPVPLPKIHPSLSIPPLNSQFFECLWRECRFFGFPSCREISAFEFCWPMFSQSSLVRFHPPHPSLSHLSFVKIGVWGYCWYLSGNFWYQKTDTNSADTDLYRYQYHQCKIHTFYLAPQAEAERTFFFLNFQFHKFYSY